MSDGNGVHSETVAATVSANGDQEIAVSLAHFDAMLRAAQLVVKILRETWNNDALSSLTLQQLAVVVGLYEVRDVTEEEQAESEGDVVSMHVIDPVLLEIVAGFETEETPETVPMRE